MSPRAIIMPSETRRISSMLLTPCAFSIFAMILMVLQPFSSRISRICKISCAQRVKEAAIKSNPALIPKRISSRSLSLKYGIDRSTFGTLTPLRSEIGPPLRTTQLIRVSSTFSTSSSIRPSSIRMWSPLETSLGRSLKVMEAMVSSPSRSSVVSTNGLPSCKLPFRP